MKKTLTTILLIIMLLTVVGVAVVPQVSFGAEGFIEGIKNSVINSSFAWIANLLLSFTSLLVTISGTFLSISINITTHLGDFFNNIPALREVWIVIRNISSIFIIFVLLYTSILKIVGYEKTGLTTIIKNVVIAGLLINFSLFFCRILIDASNIVSLQFYRAIAPQYQVEGLSKVSSAFYDGGLSNVFMSSLKIPKIYQSKDALKSTDIATSIGFYAVGGIIMMVTAAFSFLAAAIAFTARTGILLFVMALSPLYFAAMIFPQLEEKSKEIFNLFKNQLLFMPIYLLLMYVALKLISSPGFTAIFNQSAQGNTIGGGFANIAFIGVVVQYVIALIFINAPLVAALQFGAKGARWTPNATAISKWIGGATWRNTGSRVASRIAQNETLQRFAGSSLVGEQLRKGVVGVAKGYDKKLTERLASREATYNSLTDSQARTNYSGRLTSSLLGRTGRLSMATTGRADRVGAARILTRRQNEITTEINRLVNRAHELTTLPVRVNNPRSLDAVETQELADITRVNPNNPGHLQTARADLVTIQGQMRQFQTNSGGASPRQVNRRGY